MPTAEAPPAPGVSLAGRLAAALAIVLLAGGAAVALAAFAYGRHAAQQAYDRLLVGAANQIAGSITVQAGQVRVDLPMAAFELLALAPEDRVLYAVLGPAGEVVTGYEGVAPAPGGAAFHTQRFGSEPFRLATVERRFAERGFTGVVSVVVGQTTRARAELAREITGGALAAVAVVGLLTVALAVLAMRAALRPLRRIEEVMSARDPRDLTPLDLEVPREVGGLVAAINRFMARLDRQMAATRSLIADASHQIRTPIAALRAQADLAAEEGDPERQRAIVARIHDRAVNLGRLTDQMLSQAMIIHRADAVPREPVDLRTVAIQVVEESDHDLLVGEDQLRLDLPVDPVRCRGDALSLAEAVKNLVVNAFRYGVPPVTLTVARPGTAARIAVTDRGPGLPEAAWADVGRRYARQSGVSPQSAGLGLAIVTAVAQAHGGELQFSREAGGFTAALVLPAEEP